MNPSLAGFADLASIIVSVLTGLLLTVRLYRRKQAAVPGTAAFLMLFGPAAIAVHMGAHTVAVAFLAAQKFAAGAFTYDFRFYALLLMAGVLGVLSIRLVRQSIAFSTNKEIGRKARLATCGLIVLVAAPTIPFTFIGSLPVLAVVINGLAALFVHKRQRPKYGPLQTGKAAPVDTWEAVEG